MSEHLFFYNKVLNHVLGLLMQVYNYAIHHHHCHSDIVFVCLCIPLCIHTNETAQDSIQVKNAPRLPCWSTDYAPGPLVWTGSSWVAGSLHNLAGGWQRLQLPAVEAWGRWWVWPCWWVVWWGSSAAERAWPCVCSMAKPGCFCTSSTGEHMAWYCYGAPFVH